MKQILTFLVFALSYMLCGAQATSLTVDNQTPGWLSSKINYGDQQTVENLTITGYINGSDIEFIRDLNLNRNLRGEINLKDVSVVKGGTISKYPVEKDNLLPAGCFTDLKSIRKFVYPQNAISKSPIPCDTVIITNMNIKELRLSDYVYPTAESQTKYCYIPDGVEIITDAPTNAYNMGIRFPSTLKEFSPYGGMKNARIFAEIINPELFISEYETYYSDGFGNGHRTKHPAISESTIYVPKGHKEQYLNSSLKNNTIIEYYDLENLEFQKNIDIYTNDIIPLEVNAMPDENLVSYYVFESSDENIVTVNAQGNIHAIKYGNCLITISTKMISPFAKGLNSVCQVNVYEHVESIEIPKEMMLEVGKSKKIQATIQPIGKALDKVTWKTSDPSVATIDDNGEVKGISKGQCTIIATTVDGNFKAYCDVNVIIPVESVTISSKSISVPVNSDIKFSVTVKPYSAWDISVNWSSSDENVVQIDNEGNAKAVSGGKAKIFATSNYNPLISDFCEITVIQPVTGVLLNQNTAEITVDGSLQLVATVLPENSTNKNVTWSSSDVGVAMVSGNGIVYGIKPGQATIMATTEDGGFSALCKVAVGMNSAIEDITIDNQESVMIYSVQGLLLFKGLYIELPYLNNGIYILKTESGKTIKLIINN